MKGLPVDRMELVKAAASGTQYCHCCAGTSSLPHVLDGRWYLRG